MTRCPICDHQNAATAAICAKCGGPLMPASEVPAETAADIGQTADDTEQELLELLRAGRRVAAVKKYSEQTGSSLQESVDAINDLAARNGIQARGAGCATSVLIAILLSLGTLCHWI